MTPSESENIDKQKKRRHIKRTKNLAKIFESMKMVWHSVCGRFNYHNMEYATVSDQTKAFMSIEEVADLLGVNYQLIYRQIRSGALRAARIGRVYRVARADLEAYLEEAKREGATGETVCSACGQSFRSASSFPGSCGECGAPICTDCWMRLGARRCSEHA
jgi:excisionase family DNA binding protein